MPREQGRKLIAQNRKARHDYSIESTFEAGIVLTGTEVKSLRAGRATLTDGFATIDDGEAWDLSFPHSRSQCVQDLKIVFEDDNSSVIWDGFDLCVIRKITLIYNRKTDQTSAISE